MGGRVLVTGASGFIGRWSVRPLIVDGFDVHAVMSHSAQRTPPVELLGSTVHVADLLDETAIDELLDRVKPTHLLHFAWIATPGIYWSSPDNNRWLAASQYLLRSFQTHGGVRAMMAGTCAEYDWSMASVCDERTTPLADESAATTPPYAACKIVMQRALADFGRREHMSTAWGRIFFQFGPYEHPTRLVPSVIRHLLQNEPAPCAHGRQIRTFLHVADVGAAFAKVLASEVDGPVNIGSEQSTTIGELIERIGLLTQRSELVRVDARPGLAREPLLLVPQTHRLRDEVQWRPQYTLNEGLSDVIRWWRGQLIDGASARSDA